MSDSINVRVTLDSYDVVHPSEKQTQVYVQIPEVARASWLLDAEFYSVLKDEPWPHVVDTAREAYERRGVVSDSNSAAARAAIVKWLSDDANHDAMSEAWFQDRARRDPVSRSLLRDKERLETRLAELEAAAYGDAKVRLLEPVDQIRHLHAAVAAQLARADTLDRLLREKQDRVAELEAQREALAERLLAGQRWERGRDPELVSENFVSQSELRSIFGIPLVAPWDQPAAADGITRRIAPVQALRDDEPEMSGREEWCTGCNTDHAPSECGYRPEAGDA
ncbi:hypothetical protein ACFY74_11985 [Streptomyces massasporeus]|uniref:hypothetical protein n=1 Tax=Streptomyces massasporeus TaxID=67324 RepID=UPI00368C607E